MKVWSLLGIARAFRLAMIGMLTLCNQGFADWTRVPDADQETRVSTIGPDGQRLEVVAVSSVEWNSSNKQIRTTLESTGAFDLIEVFSQEQASLSTQKKLVLTTMNPFTTIKVRYLYRGEEIIGSWVVRTRFKAPLTYVSPKCSKYELKFIPPEKPPEYLFQTIECETASNGDPQIRWTLSEDGVFTDTSEKSLATGKVENKKNIRLIPFPINRSPYFPEHTEFTVAIEKPAFQQRGVFKLTLTSPPQVRKVYSWGLLGAVNSYQETTFKLTENQADLSVIGRGVFPIWGARLVGHATLQSTLLPVYQSATPKTFRTHWQIQGSATTELRFPILKQGLMGGVGLGYSALSMISAAPKYGVMFLGGPSLTTSLYWKPPRGRLFQLNTKATVFGKTYKTFIEDSRIELELQGQLTKPDKPRSMYLLIQGDAWSYSFRGNWNSRTLKRQSLGIGLRWEY